MNIFRDHYGKSQLSKTQILKDPTMFMAFGFGTGLSRYMPGTIGTLAAIPLYLLIAESGLIVYTFFTISVTLIGIQICDSAAHKLQVHDFGGIVWDEIAGLLITLWMIPFSMQNFLIGFVLFRIFDIFKPWPIKWIDKQVHGGLGIMLDDVIAGIFACLILHLIV